MQIFWWQIDALEQTVTSLRGEIAELSSRNSQAAAAQPPPPTAAAQPPTTAANQLASFFDAPTQFPVEPIETPDLVIYNLCSFPVFRAYCIKDHPGIDIEFIVGTSVVRRQLSLINTCYNQ